MIGMFFKISSDVPIMNQTPLTKKIICIRFLPSENETQLVAAFCGTVEIDKPKHIIAVQANQKT